jgi:hypothetical protein
MVVYHRHKDSMFTKKARTVQSQRTFAERVAKWSEFGGEGDKQQMSEMIVAYYNDTHIRDSKAADVQVLKLDIAHRFTEKLEGLAELLRAISYFHLPRGMGEKEAAEELKKHRPNFCAALRWLCSPKTPEPAVSAQELKKLAGSMKLERGRYPDIDETNERFVKYFEDHGLRHLEKRLALEAIRPKLPNDASIEETDNWSRQWELPRRKNNILIQYARPSHVIDLFCVFLLKECLDREPSQMPVKLCSRCGALFSVSELEGKARERKKFCSTKCQESTFWTRERRADYRYVERLVDKYKDLPPKLRVGLQQPKTQTRLYGIIERWKDWPLLSGKLRELGVIPTSPTVI